MSIATNGYSISPTEIAFDTKISSFSEDSDFEFPIRFMLDLEVLIGLDDEGIYSQDDITFTRVVMDFGDDERIILNDDHSMAVGLNENNTLKGYIFRETEQEIIDQRIEDDSDRGDYLYEQHKQRRIDGE